MSRYTLIRDIFDNIPATYKGLNRDGEHIVQLNKFGHPVYATLERLPDIELSNLAEKIHSQPEMSSFLEESVF